MSVTPSLDNPPANAAPAGLPLKMKIRPDLTFENVTYQGIEYWVVKEPLGQKYFQFSAARFLFAQTA